MPIIPGGREGAWSPLWGVAEDEGPLAFFSAYLYGN